MKHIWLFLIVTVCAFGQVSARNPNFGQNVVIGYASLPAACYQRQIAMLTTTGVLYVCSATNTWTAVGMGAAGPAGPVGPAGPSGIDGAPGVPGYSPNSLLSAGGVSWLSELTFRVSSSIYLIGNVSYTSPQVDLTLSEADATNPRIDAIVVNSSSVAAIVQGTPAASPALPDIDPSTQVLLTWVHVAALATEPTNVTLSNIYQENVEWTATKSGTPINLASTNNPLAGAVCIEVTAGVAGNYIYFAAPSPFVPDSTANRLVLNIRSKAIWGSGRSLQLYFANNANRRGSIVVLNESAFGFSSGNVTDYQQIVIPMSLFATNGLTANRFYIRLSGTGGTFGAYLDSITLQQGLIPPAAPIGVSWKKAWSSVIAYAVNDAVSYGGSSWVAIGSNTNSAPSDVSTDWSKMVAGMVGDAGAGGAAGLVPTPGVGDAVNFLRGDATWAAAGGGGGSIKRGTYADLPACDSSLTDVLYLVTTAPMSMHCNGTSYLPLWHNYIPGGSVANLTDFGTVVGTDTATLTDTLGGILVTTDDAEISTRTKTVALAAPYRYSMCADFDISTGQDNRVGLWVASVANNKGYLYGLQRHASGPMLFVDYMDASTNYQGSSFTAWPGQANITTNFLPPCWGFRDDGTNVHFETSQDGINWSIIVSTSRAGHLGGAIDRIGFQVRGINNTWRNAVRFGTWSFAAP